MDSNLQYAGRLRPLRFYYAVRGQFVNYVKDKGNIHPRRGHEGPEGDYRYSSTQSLTSALDGVGGQRLAPAALPPGKDPVPIV